MTAHLSKINSESSENYPGTGVSIIVLNKNGGIHLKNLFESFFACNSHGFYEFIVVDHASTDNSLNVLKGFEKKLNIRVIKENTNKSFSHSNNNAASLSRYGSLLFVNNDIVIKNDVVPGVLNCLKNPEVGVVGINLYYPGESMEHGLVQHAGIRFKEDLRHQFFRPYNLKSPGTGKKEYVPAITGAFLACHKSDFIKAGGFCESYFYGYEDVDLCLSIAKYTKKKCLIDHDLFAIHDESSTQKKDARRSIKRRRLSNIGALISRYGYALKRAAWQDMYNKSGFWTESRPVVGFAVTDAMLQAEASGYIHVSKLAGTLAREWGFECRLIPGKSKERDWYNATGLDVLVVMESAYDPTKLKNAKSSLIKTAWIPGFPEEWICKGWFDNYDLYLCTSHETVDSVREMTGYEAHELNGFPVYNSAAECGQEANDSRSAPGEWDKFGPGPESMTLAEPAFLGIAEKFARILGDYRGKKYRISIKIAVRSYKGINKWTDYRYALEMKSQLKRLGHSVRIDIFPEWYRSESFGDDVVIVLRGFSEYKPSGSHINLMWNIGHYEKVAPDEYAGYDHVFILSEALADRLKKSLGAAVSMLMRDAESSGYGFMYDGFPGYIKASLAAVKNMRSREPAWNRADRLTQKNVFARQVLEILKVVDECNARKSIN